MRTHFSSESSGEWRVALEADSGIEGDELRRLFDLQPKGMPCNLDQRKDNDGSIHTTFIIFSPRPHRAPK